MRQPENDEPTRGIAVLGSTGSIGTQALDVIREQRDALLDVATGYRPEYERLSRSLVELHDQTCGNSKDRT